MEWISNIIKFLKIPMKVMLPSAWLFSGALIFLPERLMEKLNVLEWKNKNGFIIGIIFLVTSCFILIYIAYFIREKVSTLYYQFTRNKRTFKRIIDMNDAEQSIIAKMYNSPGYTITLDYAQPITQGLLSRGYIYGGNQQLISMDMITNVMYAKFTLQPFIYKALDSYRLKLYSEIEKLTKKISVTKSMKKKEKLEEYLENCKGFYEMLYGAVL